MGAKCLWNHIWKRPLLHCAVSLHSALEWKIRRPNFQFLKIRLSFFVKICPNCVLFWFFLLDASSNSDETSRHREQKRYRFLLIFIQFFPVLYKTGHFLLHITMIMMYLPTVLSFFGTVWTAGHSCCIFLQQCFCKLASTSGWILPSTSKLSDCQAFCWH